MSLSHWYCSWIANQWICKEFYAPCGILGIIHCFGTNLPCYVETHTKGRAWVIFCKIKLLTHQVPNHFLHHRYNLTGLSQAWMKSDQVWSEKYLDVAWNNTRHMGSFLMIIFNHQPLLPHLFTTKTTQLLNMKPRCVCVWKSPHKSKWFHDPVPFG